MMRSVAPLALLVSLCALPAGAEGTPAEGAEDGAEAPTHLVIPMLVGEVAFSGEVAIVESPPADLRILRDDGASMADQGYLLADLGRQACVGAGYRFDEALPAILAADGSWVVKGGCW